jgi:1-acyl-sn-glycerol-3-phosphate acyltransferase
VRALHLLRTVVYLIPAITIYTIVLGTISLVSSLVDRSGDFGHRCARVWSSLILKTTGVHVHVSGMDHLDPARNYVFASNHQSIYDIPIVFATLPFQLRIVAKQSLGRIPFLGWHLGRTGHLLVDRSKPGAGVVKKMARLVNEQHSLIVFPEGTRSVDGTVGRFKGGSFVLAIESGLPIVPVSIAGSRHVMTKGHLMVRPGEVTLTVHAPVDTATLSRDAVRELADQLRERIRVDVDEPNRSDQSHAAPRSSAVDPRSPI